MQQILYKADDYIINTYINNEWHVDKKNKPMSVHKMIKEDFLSSVNLPEKKNNH